MVFLLTESRIHSLKSHFNPHQRKNDEVCIIFPAFNLCQNMLTIDFEFINRQHLFNTILRLQDEQTSFFFNCVQIYLRKMIKMNLNAYSHSDKTQIFMKA